MLVNLAAGHPFGPHHRKEASELIMYIQEQAKPTALDPYC